MGLLRRVLVGSAAGWLLAPQAIAGSPALWDKLSDAVLGTYAGQPAAAVPASRQTAWWQAMHQHLKQRAGQGPVQLLFIGDSITEAMDGVKDLLQKNWGAYQPANFGIGGDTTEQLLWRVRDGELNGLHPKLIVVLIGTNNLGRDKDNDIVAGVKANVDELRRRVPAAKILVLGILPRGHEAKNRLRARIRQINLHLQTLADGKHQWFADVGDKLLQPDGSIAPEVMLDYLHPTRHGYEIMFGALKPTIDKLLRP